MSADVLDAALAEFQAELGVDFNDDTDNSASSASSSASYTSAPPAPAPARSAIMISAAPQRAPAPEISAPAGAASTSTASSSFYGPVRTSHSHVATSASAHPYARAAGHLAQAPPSYHHQSAHQAPVPPLHQHQQHHHMAMMMPAGAYVGVQADPYASAIGAAAVAAASAASNAGKEASSKDDEDEDGQKHMRRAAGKVWNDPTMDEWPENDVRLFVGNLGNEVSDDMLSNFFSAYPSFAKAKVVREKRTGKTKGFGFASFLDPNDAVKAFRDKHGKYLGSRPCSITRSTWKDRDLDSYSHGKGKGKKH